MRKPNLFIVGAPKCGTTSLFAYLREHPGVYSPDFKELRFFCTDFNIDRILSMEAYLQAFAPATAEQTVLCDASPCYISSKVAVPDIHTFNPDAKIIVMLRHPVDLFFSIHGQSYYVFSESVPDPEEAWRLQERRARGEAMPPLCREPAQVQYRDRCALGEQIERILRVFPREQVLVISLDELKADPKVLYEKVLAFLGLESDGRTDFPKENSSKTHRFQWLGRRLMMRRKNFLKLTSDSLKTGSVTKRIILRVYRKTGSTLRRWNTVPYRRPAPRPEFVQELIAELQPEVDKVKALTGIELKSSLLK